MLSILPAIAGAAAPAPAPDWSLRSDFRETDPPGRWGLTSRFGRGLHEAGAPAIVTRNEARPLQLGAVLWVRSDFAAGRNYVRREAS